MGFVDYRSKKLAPHFENINLPPNTENIGMEELPGVANDIDQSIQGEMQALFDNVTVDTQTDLSMREILALDEALQKSRGELVNNLAKLRELDDVILLEQNNLAQAQRRGNEEAEKEIKARMKDLEIERSGRLEAASTNDKALRGQINRIKETINQILNEDTTLSEKVRILFREQGVTVVSILSAIALAISTIVASIIASVKGVAAIPNRSLHLHQVVVVLNNRLKIC